MPIRDLGETCCCCPLTNRCRLLSEEIAAAKRSLLLVHVFSAEPELSKPPEREDLISACRCFIARPVKVDYFPRLARPRNVGRLGCSEPDMTIILIDYFLRKQFRRCCWRYCASGKRDSHDEKNPSGVRHPIVLFRFRFSRNGCRDNATLCMSYKMLDLRRASMRIAAAAGGQTSFRSHRRRRAKPTVEHTDEWAILWRLDAFEEENKQNERQHRTDFTEANSSAEE